VKKMLEPIKRETVTDKIIQQIRVLIESGELQPGKKIPSERVLAEALSVSRIAVREAIKSLEAKGFLEVKAGEGTYVRTVTAEDLIDPLAMLLITNNTFKELLEVRWVIEVQLASFAAERATEEDLIKMRESLKRMNESIKKGENHLEADLAFHEAMARASNNELLGRMLHTIGDLVREAIRKTTQVPGSSLRAYHGHAEIYRNIADGNPEGSREAMSKHLKEVEEDLVRAQMLQSAIISKGSIK
jgi:GntR family transcriptional repressor for pyruvate dehydrogenase complex